MIVLLHPNHNTVKQKHLIENHYFSVCSTKNSQLIIVEQVGKYKLHYTVLLQTLDSVTLKPGVNVNPPKLMV